MIERQRIFEETEIKEKVVAEIRALAIVYGIDKVVLFGSRARGETLGSAATLT